MTDDHSAFGRCVPLVDACLIRVSSLQGSTHARGSWLRIGTAGEAKASIAAPRRCLDWERFSLPSSFPL
jgi:hypothetical protein